MPTSPRILVVDDNRDASDSLAELLMFKGFDTHVAYGGAQALNFAARHHPDIIFLDINMPEVDGYLVAGALRELLASSAYIVALTAYNDAETLARVKTSGFDEHIAKPAPFASILRVIAEHNPRQRS
ncbi:response regulator receiver domain-containing protein [Pseudoduganella lurida]|uniref:Response regulator receiver domain-containing protein n=1 Tax=Pseudoduganella lurida TaxID=1036180 RepID=A0A562RLB6_9BURK|nr:response regulator [Pseudoduganella lurida]TWI69821.1 response regulator receiver domain-containing protein [Pseudoduganella lurida]